MKPQDLRRYAKIVSDIIDSTQSNGEDLNADYEVLRKSIDDKTVSDLGSDRLTQIKTHFQSGTDKYQDNVNKLEQARYRLKYWVNIKYWSEPMRIMRMHVRI